MYSLLRTIVNGFIMRKLLNMYTNFFLFLIFFLHNLEKFNCYIRGFVQISKLQNLAAFCFNEVLQNLVQVFDRMCSNFSAILQAAITGLTSFCKLWVKINAKCSCVVKLLSNCDVLFFSQ